MASARPVSAPHVRAARLGGLLAAATLLAGCSTLRPTQEARAPDNYQERHPIVLTNGLETLDVFPGIGADPIGSRQRADVRAFAGEYRQRARGTITAAVPRGGNDVGVSASLAAIRRELSSAGYSGPLQVASFRADPSRGVAPIRLSFQKLEAKVASQCGLWPRDLGGALDKRAIPDSWHNDAYHNLGCAYQTMIAAQVDNPVDLVRPRAEGAIDVTKRTKDIEELRKNNDPATKWVVKETSLGEAAK